MADTVRVVVVGYDNWTEPVLDELDRLETDYTVLVRDEEAARRAGTRTDAVLEGVEESSFRQAGIEEASAVLIATQDDRLNVLAVLTARAIDPDIPIVAFAGENRDVSKLETAGASAVISLGDVVGEALVEAALTDADRTKILEQLTGSITEGDELGVE